MKPRTKSPRSSSPAPVPAIRSEAAVAKPAAVRRGEALLSLIDRRKRSITESFYDIGEALAEIVKKKLYLALGYRTFDLMLAKRGVMGHTQAEQLIAISKGISRDKALGLGPEKAYALIRYAASTATLDAASDYVDTGVRIGRKTRPVEQVSVRDLRDAAKSARAAAGKTPRGNPDPAATQAARAAKTMHAATRKAGLKAISAEPHHERNGWFVRVTIPLDSVAAWLALVAR